MKCEFCDKEFSKNGVVFFLDNSYHLFCKECFSKYKNLRIPLFYREVENLLELRLYVDKEIESLVKNLQHMINYKSCSTRGFCDIDSKIKHIDELKKLSYSKVCDNQIEDKPKYKFTCSECCEFDFDKYKCKKYGFQLYNPTSEVCDSFEESIKSITSKLLKKEHNFREVK